MRGKKDDPNLETGTDKRPVDILAREKKLSRAVDTMNWMWLGAVTFLLLVMLSMAFCHNGA